MSNYPQYFLKTPIAVDGDKTVPPATAQEAGTGRLSQEDGWGRYNSLPIGEGGIPPKREDFNGAFFLLSQLLLWYQQGGVMQYSVDFDYEVGNEVFHSGTKYRCLVANGPASSIVSPGSDKTVWKNLDAPSVIAGQVTPFYNCKLGGSDGRRLIPWGESVADERYILCDGGSDGLGGNVPNLIDRFVLPSTVEDAGKTGGSESAQTTEVKISGTVGETVLTLDQIPSHSHSGTTTSAGSHTHSRGSMNIQGSWLGTEDAANNTSGAIYSAGRTGASETHHGNTGNNMQFDASRNWTGETSSAGGHTHDFALGNAGGGLGHTHTLTGASHKHTVSIPKPLFYRLAFFVKIPE